MYKSIPNLEPLDIAGGNRKWYSCCGNGMMAPEKSKHRITIWFTNSTSGYVPQKLKAGTQTDFCTPMFRAALFPIANWWKQTKCPSVDE